LPVKFAVATGWVAVAVVRNQEFLQLVAVVVAVVDFQVKKPDPTGPENSTITFIHTLASDPSEWVPVTTLIQILG
jgi:hypothetical protein